MIALGLESNDSVISTAEESIGLFVYLNIAHTKLKCCCVLGRHGSDSLCRVERKNKIADTYKVLAFKR